MVLTSVTLVRAKDRFPVTLKESAAAQSSCNVGETIPAVRPELELLQLVPVFAAAASLVVVESPALLPALQPFKKSKTKITKLLYFNIRTSFNVKTIIPHIVYFCQYALYASSVPVVMLFPRHYCML